ncbi:MAG: DUF4835 family protein [Bacteroidota bacterium]
MMKYLLCFLLLFPVFLFSQELDATVSMNTEKLTTQNRDLLIGFEDALEEYLNNTRFTGNAWQGGRIRCAFNIFFVSGDDQNHYTAQVNITSLRPIHKTKTSSLMLNVMDTNWEFIYERGQSFYFNTMDFNSLTSFLDFYAFLVIGLDNDSYEQLSGTSAYSQALNIAVLGASSTFTKGWERNSNSYNRRVLADDLLSEKFRQFRENFFDYHYNGLDLMSTDRQTGISNVVKLINNLEVAYVKRDLRGVLMKVFFDTKSTEIVNVLKSYQDKNIYTILKKIDPGHISKYDEAMGE